MILVGVWAGMPQTTIALLAGRAVDPGRAARGGGRRRRDRAGSGSGTITLPQLRPVIIAITTLDFIWNFNSFGLVYVLTQGGPGGKTKLPMLFAYNEAFKYGEFGYAAALGDAMVLVIAGAARLLPLGPAEGDDAVIVSSRPKAARTAQYVALAAYMLFLALPAALAALGVVQGAARARRAPSDADPAPTRRSRTTATRSPRTSCCTRAFNSFKVAAATAMLTTLVGAAGGVRARRRAGLISTARARLDPAQPDVPADPDHHPALPGARTCT